MHWHTRELKMTPQAYVGGSVPTDPLPAGKQNENIFAPNFMATGRAPKFTELLKLQSRVNRTMHQS